MTNTYVYIHKNSIYINLTNRCTNNCDFCLRNTMDGIDGYDLWLIKEPAINDVVNDLNAYKIENYNEVVFCGFGEPTIKLDVLLGVSKYIKDKNHNTKIRINTNGQANLYHGFDVTPKFAGLIDSISISLNFPNKTEYQEICHSDFGEDSYEGLLEFARLSKKYVSNIRLSVVDIIGDEKIEECQKIADNNNIELFIRHML